MAEDIAKDGTASPAYAKAKAAMDAGTKFSVKLTNGETLEYRIVGINHDDLADGTGKAGLTFEATNGAMGKKRMSDSYYNFGGWEHSELRGRLNSGDLWALLPAEIQSRAKAVTKQVGHIPRHRDGHDRQGRPSLDDRGLRKPPLQANGHLQSDGSQYEYYAFKGVTQEKFSGASSGSSHWTRSVCLDGSQYFRYVHSNGDWSNHGYTATDFVFPAWCF